MLSFLLQRLSPLANTMRLLVATTRNPEDDFVAEQGMAVGCSVIRGEEDDVLARYIRCLEAFPADIVVRVTADNPFTCPEQLAETVAFMERTGADYSFTDGLPVGVMADCFRTSALLKAHEEGMEPRHREHINAYLLENPHSFRLSTRPAPQNLARPDLRMTIDTPEDYQRVSAVLSAGDENPWRMSLAEAIARMDNNAV